MRLLLVAHLDALPEALAFLLIVVVIAAAAMIVVVPLPVLLLDAVLLDASQVLSCVTLVSALQVWGS